MNIKIGTTYHEATSQYGAHMGTCHHFPAYAEAWIAGRPDGDSVTVLSTDWPLLSPAQLQEKARAILRCQIGRAN